MVHHQCFHKKDVCAKKKSSSFHVPIANTIKDLVEVVRLSTRYYYFTQMKQQKKQQKLAFVLPNDRSEKVYKGQGKTTVSECLFNQVVL